MAWVILDRAILVLLLSAPDQRQARTKGFMNEAAPSSGLNSLHGQRSHIHIALARAIAVHQILRERNTSALYMACSVTMTVIPYVAEFVNGSS